MPLPTFAPPNSAARALQRTKAAVFIDAAKAAYVLHIFCLDSPFFDKTSLLALPTLPPK